MKILDKNELKIGYLVSLKIKTIDFPVSAIVSDQNTFWLSDEAVIDINSSDIEKVFAIPVNLHCLFSLGFRQSPEYCNYLTLKIGTNGIAIERENNIIKQITIVENGIERPCNYKYVHELQDRIWYLNLIKETSK